MATDLKEGSSIRRRAKSKGTQEKRLPQTNARSFGIPYYSDDMFIQTMRTGA